MVQRNEYLDQLKKWKDEQVIKVITGIRRCGKSTLLDLYQDYLKSVGITDDQIISINFEELEYEELLDYKTLYNYIKDLSSIFIIFLIKKKQSLYLNFTF